MRAPERAIEPRRAVKRTESLKGSIEALVELIDRSGKAVRYPATDVRAAWTHREVRLTFEGEVTVEAHMSLASACALSAQLRIAIGDSELD